MQWARGSGLSPGMVRACPSYWASIEAGGRGWVRKREGEREPAAEEGEWEISEVWLIGGGGLGAGSWHELGC